VASKALGKSAQGVGSVLGLLTSGLGVPTLVTFLRRSCLRFWNQTGSCHQSTRPWLWLVLSTMFLLILKLDMFTLFVTTSRWWRISLSSVGGVPGGPPNRKQRREFVWSYGAPDSVGKKRECAEAFRGREIVRRDWGHDDDDGDFQRGRRSDNRRHRSLSSWARSSRCREGMDDCYSSNGKPWHSTPFRRHVGGLMLSSR
jgi:hypothetical protein